jgi:mRNA deadenylase 3'-5' endonuclease subunit Ccr4
VRLTDHDSVSRETVRRRLMYNELKPWQRKMWCIQAVDADFVFSAHEN